MLRRLAAGSFTAFLLLLCLLAAPDPALAQARCDPTLPRNDAQSSGYRPRGDRCEGIYKRPVPSFGVELVSLTAASSADLCSGSSIHMVWPAAASLTGAGPVRVRAESFRPLLYYRLDLDRPANAVSYLWPSEPRCNSDVSLTAKDVGIIASTNVTRDGKPLEVLLPVGLASQASGPVRAPYQAVLMPGARLREVYVSLGRIGASGAPTPIFSERPLGSRPYPAGARVIIPLTAADVTQPGLYRVRASAAFESGQSEVIEFYFVHGR
jgi:hypothetical protein